MDMPDNLIKVTVTPTFSTPTGEEDNLHLTTDIAGEITREIVNLKERAVREALIALGWTPPDEKRVVSKKAARESKAWFEQLVKATKSNVYDLSKYETITKLLEAASR